MSDHYEEALMLNGIAPSVEIQLAGVPGTGVPLAQTGLAAQAQSQAPTGFTTLPEVTITAGQNTPSGWPAAVTVRPDNWDMSLQPATYTIASGDTLSGLAATYLGSPNRVMEIWNMQPAQFRHSNSMDVIFPGMVFLMPDEARDNLKAWMALGQPTNKKPGGLSKSDKRSAKVRSYLPYVVGGALGLGVLWAFSR